VNVRETGHRTKVRMMVCGVHMEQLRTCAPSACDGGMKAGRLPEVYCRLFSDVKPPQRVLRGFEDWHATLQ
jgi:hypothetical protein